MMFLSEDPTDAAAAGECVREAVCRLEEGDWRPAMRHLESAAVAAPADMADSITETLASLYLSYNQHRELANLAVLVGRMTPQLAIGGLLLVRNRGLGVGSSLPSTWSLGSVLPKIREYIALGKYSEAELGVICSLLTQLRQADMAVPLLDGMLSMNLGVEEELVTGVLALAVDKHMRAEAEAIVDKLSQLPGLWPIRAQRYRFLMSTAAARAVPPAADKVADFLQRTCGRLGGGREKHGR